MSFITALFAAVGFVSSIFGIYQFFHSISGTPRRKFGIYSFIIGVILILALFVMNLSATSRDNYGNTNPSQTITNNTVTQPSAPTNTPTNPPAPTSAPTNPPVVTYTTPDQTISRYCYDIYYRYYNEAYNQLYTQTFRDNTTLSQMEAYTSCQYYPSTLNVTGSVASETIRLFLGNVWYSYKCTLVEDSDGNWRIDNICQC